jgi:hypothetical protein
MSTSLHLVFLVHIFLYLTLELSIYLLHVRLHEYIYLTLEWSNYLLHVRLHEYIYLTLEWSNYLLHARLHDYICFTVALSMYLFLEQNFFLLSEYLIVYWRNAKNFFSFEYQVKARCRQISDFFYRLTPRYCDKT